MRARTAVKLVTRVLPNLHHVGRSRIRFCRVCARRSFFLSFGPGDEFRRCVVCQANLRYELLAAHLRTLELAGRDVLELDCGTPLRPLFAQAHRHIQSFWRAEVAPGTVRADGAVCEDITRLTFADGSLDVIVSSDVLEHVPDLHGAFTESARVLRPGGCHLFTVPPRARTSRRAVLEGGVVRHLVEPEYHRDPLDPQGVLAFWDLGPDLPAYFADTGLEFRIVQGPEGTDQRVVWAASPARA